jgi:hypothetical protein
MCGGGGGGGTNTVQQTITEIPEELAPYYDELLGRGTFQSLQPYTPYPYKRLAEFSPFEQQSMAGIGSLAQTGTPEAMQSAITGSQYVAYQDPYAEAIRKDPITAAVMNTIGAAQPEQVGTLGDISTYDTYMSPYQQKVTDIAKREASRASDIQGADIGQQAALAGGLGGYTEKLSCRQSVSVIWVNSFLIYKFRVTNKHLSQLREPLILTGPLENPPHS